MRQMQLRQILDVIQPGGRTFLQRPRAEQWISLNEIVRDLDTALQLIT